MRAARAGGVYNESILSLDSVTITGNTNSALYNADYAAAQVTIKNSILANSTGGGGDCVLAGGTINAEYSLIESGLTCVNGTKSNNLTGDPNLGALANNGGPTQTHGPNVGSPAINAGSTTLTKDQRGFERPDSDDIGAVERQNPTAVEMTRFEARPAGLPEALAQLWRLLTGR